MSKRSQTMSSTPVKIGKLGYFPTLISLALTALLALLPTTASADLIPGVVPNDMEELLRFTVAKEDGNAVVRGWEAKSFPLPVECTLLPTLGFRCSV